MFYIMIAFFSVAFAIPISKKKTLINKISFFISFLIALLPMGLRYGIGTDYFYTYVPYFRWIGNGTKMYDEIGFSLLNKIIYVLTGDYRVLFFITSLIIIGVLYKIIYENSENIWLSVLLIFLTQVYFYGMNIVRQTIAIVIILYSYKKLIEDKKVQYILYGLLAFSMHTSAIIMIPILFFCKLEIKNSRKILILALTVLLFPLISNIIQKIVMNTKYAWYYNSVFSETVSNTIILENIIILFIDLFLTYRNKNNYDDEYKLLSNINFFGTLVIILSSSIPLINRIIRYFTIFQILFIPKLIGNIKKANERLLIYMAIIVMMASLTYYQIIEKGGEEVHPYVSIFDIEELKK